MKKKSAKEMSTQIDRRTGCSSSANGKTGRRTKKSSDDGEKSKRTTKKVAMHEVLKEATSFFDQAIANLHRAANSGQWMIAIWSVNAGRIELDRTAVNFPRNDIDTAMQLVVQDVQRMRLS